jgi:hypothetical protein
MPEQTEYPIEIDVTQGRWRITASYALEDNVTVYRDGEHFRTYTYPAYRIWNIPAHLDEYVTMLEHKAAVDEALASMTLAEAREVWDRQGDEDADPARVEAADKLLTEAGWQ